MKRIKLVAIGIMVVAALALAGCFSPAIVDPDDPVDPIAPVLTGPVASLYYFFTPPIQTDSWVWFNGSDSYDRDDEIMRCKWDFGDEAIKEGVWSTMDQEWRNDKFVWVWTDNDIQVVRYKFKEAKRYTVTLTVWDYDGNQDSVTRTVYVEAK